MDFFKSIKSAEVAISSGVDSVKSRVFQLLLQSLFSVKWLQSIEYVAT
jgi:hypothetical protein